MMMLPRWTTCMDVSVVGNTLPLEPDLQIYVEDSPGCVNRCLHRIALPTRLNS